MLIDATFLVKNKEIVECLLDGSMTRYGGVIRWSKYTEKAGQIVCHLAETPGLTNQLTNIPFSPLLGGTNIIGHGLTYHKLMGIEKTLSSVMGLTQIAAGASVLNLGVSIAGFAYMGYKLHQIQNKLGQIQQSMEAGFERLESGLNRIENQLTQGFDNLEKGLNRVENRLDIISG
jgi:hypothetical protein